jgi:hypothetical protein
MRKRLAIRIVDRVDSLLTTSLYWHERSDFDAAATYAGLARRKQRWFWLARLLDREAAVDRMAGAGWWG